jgi:hypothetical protein
MLRQNRLTPLGEILATPERGAFLGNRGVLHDTQGRIRRPWQFKRWIVCVLEFRDRKRQVMTPGRYTLKILVVGVVVGKGDAENYSVAVNLDLRESADGINGRAKAPQNLITLVRDSDIDLGAADQGPLAREDSPAKVTAHVYLDAALAFDVVFAG